jgi:hypothetical protein
MLGLLAFYNILIPCRMNTYPDVNFQSSRSSALSESEYPISSVLLPYLSVSTSVLMCFKAHRKCLAAGQCPLVCAELHCPT